MCQRMAEDPLLQVQGLQMAVALEKSYLTYKPWSYVVWTEWIAVFCLHGYFDEEENAQLWKEYEKGCASSLHLQKSHANPKWWPWGVINCSCCEDGMAWSKNANATITRFSEFGSDGRGYMIYKPFQDILETRRLETKDILIFTWIQLQMQCLVFSVRDVPCLLQMRLGQKKPQALQQRNEDLLWSSEAACCHPQTINVICTC